MTNPTIAGNNASASSRSRPPTSSAGPSPSHGICFNRIACAGTVPGSPSGERTRRTPTCFRCRTTGATVCGRASGGECTVGFNPTTGARRGRAHSAGSFTEWPSPPVGSIVSEDARISTFPERDGCSISRPSNRMSCTVTTSTVDTSIWRRYPGSAAGFPYS